MLYLFMGASCTGKSVVADILKEKGNVEVFSGKDYFRLAKNQDQAWSEFLNLMKVAKEDSSGESDLIYLISDSDVLSKIDHESGTIKVKFEADTATLYDRFSERIGRELPPPLKAMIDKQQEQWNDVSYDLVVDSSTMSPQDMAESVLKYL